MPAKAIIVSLHMQSALVCTPLWCLGWATLVSDCHHLHTSSGLDFDSPRNRLTRTESHQFFVVDISVKAFWRHILSLLVGWPIEKWNSIVTCRRIWVDMQVRTSRTNWMAAEETKLIFECEIIRSDEKEIFVLFVSPWLKRFNLMRQQKLNLCESRSGKNPILSHAIMECSYFSSQSNWCTRNMTERVNSLSPNFGWCGWECFIAVASHTISHSSAISLLGAKVIQLGRTD